MPTFGFLEPVYVELKLANVSDAPVVVDEHILLDRSAMVVVVKREGRDATMRMPYASCCNHASPRWRWPRARPSTRACWRRSPGAGS